MKYILQDIPINNLNILKHIQYTHFIYKNNFKNKNRYKSRNTLSKMLIIITNNCSGK